jgi:gamma-glutamylputrescine oxidase
VMPRIAGTLMPIWTYVATTAPLGPRLRTAVTYQGAVSDTDLADNHYRIVGGDRLMWSGGVTMWESNPQRFAQKLKGDIERIYPQLAPVELEQVWSGVLGNTLHRMPQIGELSPRVWLASGFGGQGLNTTAMAGNIIARAIDEGDDTWRLFVPFELVWAGGKIGRAAAKVYYSWSRSLEQSKAQRARRREEEYRRSEERERVGAVGKLAEAESMPTESVPMQSDTPLVRAEGAPAWRRPTEVAEMTAEPAEPAVARTQRAASRDRWPTLLDPRRAPPREE